jgi:hypothetical protein
MGPGGKDAAPSCMYGLGLQSFPVLIFHGEKLQIRSVVLRLALAS